MSQSDAILKRLSRGDALSPLDALNDPDISSLRLGARIHELKREGHDIETVKVRTPSGKNIAVYRLRRRMEPDGQFVLI